MIRGKREVQTLQSNSYRNTILSYPASFTPTRMDERDRLSFRRLGFNRYASWRGPSSPALALVLIFSCCVLASALSSELFAQDWVKTGTSLGVEKVRLAVPDFKASTTDPQNAALLKTFNDTLWNDLDVSGVCLLYTSSALEKGKPGERYILGGENLTLKQILDKLGEITGLPSPKLKLPYVFAFAAGVVDEAITGRILHREPRATVDTVRMGKKKMFASSGKAERELGWKIVPVEGALRRAVEWFRGNGYV